MRQTFNFPNKPGLFLSVALPAVALSLISRSNDTTEKHSCLYQTARIGAEQLASDKIEQLMSLNMFFFLFFFLLTAMVPSNAAHSCGFFPSSYSPQEIFSLNKKPLVYCVTQIFLKLLLESDECYMLWRGKKRPDNTRQSQYTFIVCVKK